jgi:flagellar basal-body rod protein FlgB
MIADIVNTGPMPALEAMVSFAGQRQRLISHNIANLSTPNFRPRDVSPQGFQRALGEAIDRRRQSETRGSGGPLELRAGGEIEITSAGGFKIKPKTPSGHVLFHDRNDRDLERTMQSLAENVAMFRLAGDMLRGRITMMREALADRV